MYGAIVSAHSGSETIMLNTVTDWGEAILTSLTAALAAIFAAIPKIIGFALILAIGWFVAGLIAKVAASLLRKIRVNELSERAGFSDFIQKMGLRCDAAGFLANLAKWFMRLVVLVVAFDALGLPAVSDVLRQVLLWLPEFGRCDRSPNHRRIDCQSFLETSEGISRESRNRQP